MSNPIQYDPLLVHYLACELRERLVGRGCRLLPLLSEDRSGMLLLEGGEALRFDLNPQRGWIRLVRHAPGLEKDADAVIAAVESPPDERRLELELVGGSRFRPLRRRLVAELHTNQWNLIAVNADDARIVAILHTRDSADRQLRAGVPYTPPPPQLRVGTMADEADAGWAKWTDALQSMPPEQRKQELLRRFAYTGSLNARAVLGAALSDASEDALRDAFERWWALASLPDPEPVLLTVRTGSHPYPFPLPGTGGDPVPSLLIAMDRVADELPPMVSQVRENDAALWFAAAERKLEAAQRKVESIRAQLAQTDEAERMRRFGDLLLAHLADVPRGASSVRLPDWEGGELEVPLDPAKSPAENAAQWYDRARRHSRAASRLPQLLTAAETEADSWQAVLAACGEGEIPEETRRELELRLPARTSAASDAGARVPYREFRTSSGIEVRVGRGAGDNDRLTFAHSHPGDIWLHARSVPGSHVILRWADAQNSPPSRDLSEAAGLAAWFSKARTSGLVAVDWTRRKYVRKPRGAPPGSVIPQQVKTLFVEPDPALEERLRASASDRPG